MFLSVSVHTYPVPTLGPRNPASLCAPTLHPCLMFVLQFEHGLPRPSHFFVTPKSGRPIGNPKASKGMRCVTLSCTLPQAAKILVLYSIDAPQSLLTWTDVSLTDWHRGWTLAGACVLHVAGRLAGCFSLLALQSIAGARVGCEWVAGGFVLRCGRQHSAMNSVGGLWAGV